MKIYYSESTSGFYNTDINDEKSLPKDCVELSEKEYKKLMNGRMNGNNIVIENGKPVLQKLSSKRSLSQQKQQLINKGLNVTFALNSKLNGIYSLNASTLSEMNNIINYIKNYNSFPTDEQLFCWQDISGNIHDFDINMFVELNKALNKYSAQLHQFSLGKIKLPENTITI